jgi:hypothetical protein
MSYDSYAENRRERQQEQFQSGRQGARVVYTCPQSHYVICPQCNQNPQYPQSSYSEQGSRDSDSRSTFAAAGEREREERRREEIRREEKVREERRRREERIREERRRREELRRNLDRERERLRQQRDRSYQPRTTYLNPHSRNTRQLPPAPFTDYDEEPASIPIAPMAWNGYRTTVIREELLAHLIRLGASEERARKIVDEEFQDHAPLHWPEGRGVGPSRYEMERERRRPPM